MMRVAMRRATFTIERREQPSAGARETNNDARISAPSIELDNASRQSRATAVDASRLFAPAICSRRTDRAARSRSAPPGPRRTPVAMPKPKSGEEAKIPLQAVVLADSFTQVRDDAVSAK